MVCGKIERVPLKSRSIMPVHIYIYQICSRFREQRKKIESYICHLSYIIRGLRKCLSAQVIHRGKLSSKLSILNALLTYGSAMVAFTQVREHDQRSADYASNSLLLLQQVAHVGEKLKGMALSDFWVTSDPEMIKKRLDQMFSQEQSRGRLRSIMPDHGNSNFQYRSGMLFSPCYLTGRSFPSTTSLSRVA
jgi:hypothetical protein